MVTENTLKRAMKEVIIKRQEAEKAREAVDKAELQLADLFEKYFEHACVADCFDEYVKLYFRDDTITEAYELLPYTKFNYIHSDLNTFKIPLPREKKT